MEKTTFQDNLKLADGAATKRLMPLIVVGAVALGLSAAGYAQDKHQFSFSYLVPFLFFLSIALSALFFVMLQHLTRAGWSVAVRRIPESMLAAIPAFVVLFVPVALGMHDLFHWTHHDAVAHDELLTHKAPFLNTPFFLARAGFYFLVWILLGWYFRRTSVRQDESHDPRATVAMARRAAPGMILFALTLSFAGFDWIMSLDPHWFSTIFGVYFFAGTAVAGFAAYTLVLATLRRAGYLRGAIRLDHFRDLGRLMFGFSVFWAYIAFSQFFLIWYGNIPEETIFYLHRMEGSWRQVTLLLAVGHFVVPFVLLMSRWTKSRPWILATLAVWILLMHYLDLYWLVMPTLHREGIHFHWMDLVCFAGVGAVFLALFVRELAQRHLIPIGDPRLPESLGLRTDY